MRAVLVEAVDDDGADDERREGEGDDDLAGDREGAGDEADQVREQHEHEEREDEGEETHARRSRRVVHGGGDEFIRHFGGRLQAGRNDVAAARRQNHQRGDGEENDQHEQRGVGEGRVDAADMQVEQAIDVELMDRIDPLRFSRHGLTLLVVAGARPARSLLAVPTEAAPRRRPGGHAIDVPEPRDRSQREENQ